MPRNRYIQTTKEAQLRVEEFGDASSNRAVVLISGAGAPAKYWPDMFCERLSLHGFRIIRFDHRDTGFSTHFDKPYPIHALIDDTKKIVSATKADDVHLIGHSMGGYIVAMMLADLDDERIKTGFAISAGPTTDRVRYKEFGMSDVSPEVWSDLEGAPLTGEYTKDLSTWLATWRLLNGNREFDVNLATNYTKALHEGDVRNRQVAVNHIHAMTTVPRDLPERLVRIARQLVIIHGSEDKLVPIDNGQALARLMPTADFHILDRAGHMFFSNEVWIEIEKIVIEAIQQTT